MESTCSSRSARDVACALTSTSLDDISTESNKLALDAIAAGNESGELIASARVRDRDLIAADRPRVRETSPSHQEARHPTHRSLFH